MVARPETIVLTGAAGLVGQNLVPRLKGRGYRQIIAIDKHAANVAILRRLHPDIEVVEANLATDDGWQELVATGDIVIISHAQIGGLDLDAFTANNITATKRLLDVIQPKTPYVVHISSSVVTSVVEDWYTQSKTAQERLVIASGLPAVILRPTLMFGWFDRKHLGWLARFMRKTPVFPIPGHGRYLRQPLYVGDFCEIVLSCIEQRRRGTYNISGLERIEYIDLIQAVKEACGSRTRILRIPYRLFWSLLLTYGLVDRNAPFTTEQLKALTTPELFEVIDWPRIFHVSPTPLTSALAETFSHPKFSNIVLEF
jgi:nucleoside-diphosphate-sugar epimerase